MTHNMLYHGRASSRREPVEVHLGNRDLQDVAELVLASAEVKITREGSPKPGHRRYVITLDVEDDVAEAWEATRSARPH